MDKKKRSNRHAKAQVELQRDSVVVDHAVLMLDELDNMLTDVSGGEGSDKNSRMRNRIVSPSGKVKKSTRRDRRVDQTSEPAILDLDVPKVDVPVSKELEAALALTKEVDLLIKSSRRKGQSNSMHTKMMKEEHEQFFKLFSDLTRPKSRRDTNDADEFVSQYAAQFERERNERLKLREMDLKLERDTKRQEREALYDLHVADEK